MGIKEAWKGLWFSFEINAEEYVAFISADALCIHFHAAGVERRHLLDAYRKHRQGIDTLAKNRFHSHAPRPVKLDVSDFRSDDVLPDPSRHAEATAVH